MADVSNISWTRSTFNPWMGCQRISRACDHCYAETLVTNRMGYSGLPGKKVSLWGPNGERYLRCPKCEPERPNHLNETPPQKA